MRFFGSDGNIKSGGSDYSWTFGYSSGDGQSDNDSNIRLGRPVGNAAHESSHYEITIFDVHDTGEATATEGYKHAMFQQSASLNDGTIVYAIGGGWYKGNVSNNYKVTGVRIYHQAGNVASGRFSLYGRKHS
jgi:acetyl esterase/lipase